MFLVLFMFGMVATAAAQAKPDFSKITQTETLGKIGIGTGLALAPFALVKTLKDKGVYEKLDDDTKKYVDTLEDQLNLSLKALSDSNMTEASVKKLFDDYIKGNAGIMTAEQIKQFNETCTAVKEHAIAFDKMKDDGIKTEYVGGIMKALKEKAASLKAADGTSGNFLHYMKQSGKRGFIEMEITKAGGADQAASDIATHTIGMRIPGIGQLPVRKPFLRDLFNTVNCSLEYIKYIDQETVTRDAKMVNSAAVSTHTTKLTWKERQIQITNVRDILDVPIDMLQDYDFVEGELSRLLNTNVALKVDDQLLNGTGAAPDLHSIAEKASEFNVANTLGGTITPWTGSVKDPNIFDLVIAMCSQIVALGQDGSFLPNAVLFNTIDRYKALLIKDSTNNYIMPPFVVRVAGREYNVDGMIVRSNPNVPANSVWVMDSTKGTIYSRKTAIAQMSFENATNFETEVVTLKVYERLNFLIRNVDANAFMKCTDVATALVALASA